jgi:hypothetical protein
MLEAVVVFLIVGIAAVFVGRFLYREWSFKNAGCECKTPGCTDSCATAESCAEVFNTDLIKRAEENGVAGKHQKRGVSKSGT